MHEHGGVGVRGVLPTSWMRMLGTPSPNLRSYPLFAKLASYSLAKHANYRATKASPGAYLVLAMYKIKFVLYI